MTSYTVPSLSLFGHGNGSPLTVHISGSENRPMSPSERGAMLHITHPFQAFPACPYTDLCTLNCDVGLSDVHDVPPIDAAAPGASRNRTSWNTSWFKAGSGGRPAKLPCPNQAWSAAAPTVPAGIVHLIEWLLPGSTCSVLGSHVPPPAAETSSGPRVPPAQ